MKKFILLGVVLISFTLKTNAQIPNSGFETWGNYVDNYTGYVYESPNLWHGSLPNNMVHSYSIKKYAESYPAGTGQYCMKIQPDIPNGVRGVGVSGAGPDSMANGKPKPSFAINYRPASLFLYYKSLPFGGDTIVAMVFFYKNGVVIGNPAFGTTQTVSSWTALEVPMTYYTSDVPDSATILFVTGVYTQHSESILYVDNLSFTGFVTSIAETKSENMILNLYPNPASDKVILNIENPSTDDLTLSIYNAMGAFVKSEIVKPNNREINVGDLSNGVYMVEIKTQEQTRMQRLIIQK